MLKKISNLGEMLSKENQKNITGGFGASIAGQNTYRCQCGFSGNGTTRYIVANSLIDALQTTGELCDGQGGTCEGI